MAGVFQRPSFMIWAKLTSCSAKDCAAPTRSECPEMRPGTPAAAARVLMASRTEAEPSARPRRRPTSTLGSRILADAYGANVLQMFGIIGYEADWICMH